MNFKTTVSYSVMLSISKLFSNVYIDALPLQELPIDYPWVDVHYLQDVGLSMNRSRALNKSSKITLPPQKLDTCPAFT